MSEIFKSGQEYESNFLDNEFGEGTTDFIKKGIQETVRRRLQFATDDKVALASKKRGYDDPSLKKQVEQPQLQIINHQERTAGRFAAYHQKIFGYGILTPEQKVTIEQDLEAQIEHNAMTWLSYPEDPPVPVAEDAAEYLMLTGGKKWSEEDEKRMIDALDQSVNNKMSGLIYSEPVEKGSLAERLRSSSILEAAEEEALRAALSGKVARSSEEVDVMVDTLKKLYIEYKGSLKNPHNTEAWKSLYTEECIRFVTLYAILKKANKNEQSS